MKKYIHVAIATVAFLCACSSKINSSKNLQVNQVSIDKNGKAMLIGLCTQSALEKPAFRDWFKKNFTDYKVNDTITNLLKPLVKGKTFKLFMGTWCGDSKREIPRILKIIREAGIKKSQVELVMVDNHDSTYKQSPGHEEIGLNIHRVPTMIVYDQGKEIGRMVESPVISIEKDLFAILNNENYKPNYQGVIFMDSLFKVDAPRMIESRLEQIASHVKPILKNSAEFNTYGYVLMARKEMEKAQLIFKLNILLYPKNANLYDSMGEFYFKTGNKEAAKENYQKVLEIDPLNKNAKKMIAQLGT